MELLNMVAALSKVGVATTLRGVGETLIAEFEDGFYKSDGMAHLKEVNGRLYLNARYGETKEVLGINDVIKCSREWHEYSRDRFEGWKTPPAHWAALYETLST